MFLSRTEVQRIIENAIRDRKILKVRYQHVGEDQDIVTRTKAPFDIGTTNPKTYERNKNNLYMFCYDHRDEETGLSKPMVHPISILHVISISETGELFNPSELTDIHRRNTGFNYRTWRWAVVPDRNWY